MRTWLVSDLPEKTGQNPFSHPPHDRPLQLVRIYLPALTTDLEVNGVMRLGPQQIIHGHPMVCRDLSIEDQARASWGEKDERPNRDRRQHRGARYDVFQAPGEVTPGERHADLLFGLSHDGRNQVSVTRLLPPAGQCHVPGPGVPGTVRPADQQNGIGVRRENQCDRGPDQAGIVIGAVLQAGQALAQASAAWVQCECDPQLPPPQQPPPEGGVRRL